MESTPKQPVPVFPLPGLVLFPHAVLPLHIFELRYRTLVRDALSGERLIALALLQPGWERDYHASPQFYPLGCLARFEEVQWLPDDCYDLKIVGLSRVRFERVVREFPYRTARLSVLPEAPYTEDDPFIQLEKRALLETFDRWRRAASGAVEVDESTSLRGELRYEILVNIMCMLSDAGPRQKLELLEMDSVIDRGRRVRALAERRLRGAPGLRVVGGGEQN